MGKHKGRGSGGGGGSRPAALRGDALVVVNPSMLQSAVRRGPRTQRKGKKKAQSQPKKRKADDSGANGLKKTQKKRKKQQDDASIVSNVAVSSAAKLTVEEGGGASCSVLTVKRDGDLLAGLYWVLQSRNTPRACVVALPSQFETSPAQLAAMLKHLGFQAVALHRKMTAGQRNETVQRLKSSTATVTAPLHAMVLVTTDHLLASAAHAKADVTLVGGVSAAAAGVATAKFAHVHQVTAGMGAELLNSSVFKPQLTTPCLQQLQARLKLAGQIVDIAQRVGKTGAATQDGDDKWARKFAKGADLDDDEDDNGHKKKKRAMTPDEQRLQALTEKLYVSLTRKLPGLKSYNSNTSAGGEQETDSQHRREKLEVLGLVTVNAAVGTAMTDERTSAQTRWMDFAEGRAHGGQWEGAVRHGASKDVTSLAVREKLCAARGKAKDATFLSKWAPNKEPVDAAKWGGAFGKVCGHNEVVMNALRSFYPQEVLNSKVCSKLFPAPGNQGFDGCLEHLRLACMAQGKSMTLWDAEYFVFISSRGRVSWSKKSQLLSLSLASLQCLVPALRSWTTGCEGHLPPNAVLRAIQLCCQLGSGDKRSSDDKLPPKALKRIMTFAFGGSARLWRQIAKLPTPLEEETVYDAQ
ncbi:hypothetical protein PF005_g14022 [Phytophthora fragariae]|uniref:Uncharacterized protein n=1 Tax=Phytophthora fragariae TaxID=53985 RepID=A0A6A3RW30_9STRA|nr:hypothetical protein PF003_g26180 [Phytophthora fragariae]KAE8934422.1 hypothetical protein PF009_g15602 [Phytophthora fragariae]KAE9004303.1 hypothetical protein PF011_g12506 [Phytophthora fragariae]KAE9102957.1 hypothetical protein PF010_g13925 [Phytophthora fragariae]KAE9104345.1 hypothetical protein PF007_g14086 [Phytophthora fragariae]